MDTHNWYVNIEDKGRTVLNLVRVGADVFGRARLIQEFSEFSLACSLANSGKDEEYKARLLPFLDEYLIDSIRVCIFFENYMKAALIERRYIAHRIGEGLPDLRKEQKRRPISFNELTAVEPFTDVGGMNVIHNGLEQFAIGAETLFGKQAYREAVDVPPHFFPHLRSLTKDRNRLHFMNYREMGHSEKFVEVLGEMMSFVDLAIRRVRVTYG